MKRIFIVVLLFAAVSAAFVFARILNGAANFKAAEDFPRDALIYMQIRDLPALIKLWNESDLRAKYLESENFGDFESNHLALKLAARADEIEDALGIFPDLNFLSGLSETSAALAVYDVGRMEFVFIAPLGEEKILASSLFQMQPGFEEIRLDDQTLIYTKEIEIDRARQRQKILFTNFRGRLILATSEKYFRQTLDNIRGKTPQNRLSGEPLFRPLAEKTKPHLASVWLNQQKLNDDWYFKHYWLMSEPENLKNLRAGMFDFEIRDKKIVETRAFLTGKNEISNKINAAAANRLRRLIPENVLFYKFEAASAVDFADEISETLFDAKLSREMSQTAQSKNEYYFSDWRRSGSYSYLDDDFNEQINESDDEEIIRDEKDDKTGDALSKIVAAANPQFSVKLFAPENLAPPLFFENRRALIFSVPSAESLNRQALENALAETARKTLTVDNRTGEFVWTDLAVGNFRARSLSMPALGWQICYFAGQNELIFANSADLLTAVLKTNNTRPNLTENFERLTVIDLANGRARFLQTFQILETGAQESGNQRADSFFTGNISGLLDVISDVEKVEIRQTSAPGFLFEEIDFILKEKPE